MRFTRNEHAFWIGCVVIIAGLSGWLYYDMNLISGGARGKPVAKITFKRKTAQRRFQALVVWEGVKTETLLYNGDAIRTGDGAEATITILKTKTQIELDGSSMIVLNITDDSANINYAYGSLRANNAAGKGAALNIKTKDNKTITIQNSDVKLATTKGKDLNVTVSKGEAKVSVGGKAQTLKKDQLAILSGNKVQIRPLNLKPVAPADNARFFVQAATASRAFSWAPITGSPAVTLELASDRGFSAGIIRKGAGSGTATSTTLKPGVYYWRISARNKRSKKLEFSAVRKFTVFRTQPVVLSSPASGSRIEFVENQPLVSFAWNKNDLATGYKLEIAQNRNFTGAVQLDSANIAISRRLGAGDYFVRVSSQSTFEQARSTSPVVAFSIVKRENLPPPTPRQPAPGRTMSKVFFERQGVVFNWKSHREIRRTEIMISRSADFSEPIRRVVNANFLNLKQSMQEGKWFWRLRGLDDQGRAYTEFSKPATFNVVGAVKLALLSPAANREFDFVTAREGISLVWKRPGISGRYEVDVSSSKDFSGGPRLKNITAVSATMKGLNPGTYYWRVRLMDEGGKTALSSSAAGTFRVSNLMPSPTPEFPSSEAVVDMARFNALTLRWQKSRGATAYRVRLFRLVGGRRVMLANRRVTGTRFVFSDLARLDKGRFGWSVQALGRVAGRSLTSREEAVAFRITLSSEPGGPDIKKGVEVYTD